MAFIKGVFVVTPELKNLYRQDPDKFPIKALTNPKCKKCHGGGITGRSKRGIGKLMACDHPNCVSVNLVQLISEVKSEDKREKSVRPPQQGGGPGIFRNDS